MAGELLEELLRRLARAHNRAMSTPFRALLLALLTAGVALAQTPGAPNSRTGDAFDNAKTADYYLRYTDEVRARQTVESGRSMLHTQRYKDALAAFDGTQPKLAVAWARFVTAGG